MIDHHGMLTARIKLMVDACEEHHAASQALIDYINDEADIPAMWVTMAENIVKLADRLLYTTRAVAQCAFESDFDSEFDYKASAANSDAEPPNRE
jgi:hypothetical protein